MRSFSTSSFCLFVFALGLVPSAARAGEAESRTLFAEGRQLRERGKCQDAIVLFKKSLETYPEGLGAMRNIAECEEELGRLASARRTWRDLGLAVVRSGEARYDGWERDAEEARARLEPRVARLTITLKGKGRVLLNGLPFDPRLLGTELEQDLGRVELVLEDGGATPQSRSLELEEGQRHRVDLEARVVVPAKSQDPSAPPSSGASDGEDEGPSGLFVGGLVSLSLGATSLVGMGVAIGFYQGALSDVESSCPSYETEPCRADVTEAVESGQASSTAVNALAAIGGAGVATSVVLLVLDATTSGSSGGERATARVAPLAAPLPGGGFVGLIGSF